MALIRLKQQNRRSTRFASSRWKLVHFKIWLNNEHLPLLAHRTSTGVCQELARSESQETNGFETHSTIDVGRGPSSCEKRMRKRPCLREGSMIMTTSNAYRIVWIHGIGHQRAGYSLPWRQAFNPALNFDETQYREALWGPVFTAETVFSAVLDSPSLLQSSMALNPAEIVRANELLKSLTTTIQARKSAQQHPDLTGGWPGGVVRNVTDIGTNFGGVASGTLSNAAG